MRRRSLPTWWPAVELELYREHAGELGREHAGELGRAGERRRPGDQTSRELNHEDAGELGRASDRCRPGGQPAELELNHEHA
jgi:hypothetical protein